MYIDDLIRSLEKMHVGCRVQFQAVNVLAYADDIVLLSPSRGGLEKLIRKCEAFALSRDIIFNVKKSVCMIREMLCSALARNIIKIFVDRLK